MGLVFRGLGFRVNLSRNYRAAGLSLEAMQSWSTFQRLLVQRGSGLWGFWALGV